MMLFYSCSSDLDFEQVKKLKLEPVVVANLASFDVKAKDFFVGSVQKPLLITAPTIEILNDSFFKEYVKSVALSFEMNNTIYRDFKVDIVFLDVNNLPLNRIEMDIPAFGRDSSLTTKKVFFDNNALNVLSKTAKFAFSITMLSGPILIDSNLGDLKIRSSITTYAQLK
jgi:hypothetical protein